MKFKNHYFLLLSAIALLANGCKTASTPTNQNADWYNIATIEGVGIYIDKQSIKNEGTTAYAREKRVYLNPESKEEYIARIRKEYTEMGKPQKAEKWNNVSYSVFHCVYECANRRFRVLSVEDFDEAGNRIVKTTSPKDKIKWISVENDTLGDHTTFYICDYQ